ncbi:MAG: hypothetical protein IH888_08620, partial [Planctomycetes bacterium]|nr:hypothetical protein [Planctomycetota bacterium]
MRCAAIIDGRILSTPNGFARCFNLAAEGLQCGNFTVASVTFGVQTLILDDPLVDHPIDIVLYEDLNGCPPPGIGSAGPLDPSITELARVTVILTPADVGTFITVPIVATLAQPGGDLIVEIEQVTDGTEEPLHAFRPVSNGGGECGESYLRAAACGIPGWIALCGGIGFCDNEYVIIVEGELGPPPCPATTCSNICDCSVTQSNNTENIETQVACASDVGTTDQGWARCFDFAAEGLPTNPLGYTIQSVTFGVLIATVDGIEVDVVVYAVDSGCRVDFQAPGDPGVTEIARESILVDIEDVGTFITVQLSDKPKVPDDATIVVEIEQLVNGSVEDPAGQFSFRPSGNTNGECDISYIRAALCGLGFWIGYDFIGFDFIHTTMVVDIESNKKSAFVDIKPGSCPNPLNRNSNGVLPVALTFDPEDKSVQDVDLSTLQIHRADGVGGFVDAFSGRPGPKRNLEDVATPFGGDLCD